MPAAAWQLLWDVGPAGSFFFTSCGTEADNWAIKGTAHNSPNSAKKHLITSRIEHHAVLHSMQALKEGFEITYLPVDAEGFVSVEDVKTPFVLKQHLSPSCTPTTRSGTLEPIAEIAEVLPRTWRMVPHGRCTGGRICSPSTSRNSVWIC